MKANELMIGDYVLLNGLRWHVSAIFDDGYVKLKRWSEKQSQELEYLCKADLLSPIKLTKDMLFLNGWQETGCGFWRHKDHQKHGWTISYEIDYSEDFANGEYKDFTFCGVSGINYVHELQNMLRIISQQDFADDFKLKDDGQ